MSSADSIEGRRPVDIALPHNCKFCLLGQPNKMKFSRTSLKAFMRRVFNPFPKQTKGLMLYSDFLPAFDNLDLVKSASKGCQICGILRDFLFQNLQDDIRPSSHDTSFIAAWKFQSWSGGWTWERYDQNPLKDHGRGDLTIIPLFADPFWKFVFEYFQAPEDLGTESPKVHQTFPWIKARRDCSGSTRDALGLAEHWLRRCLTTHGDNCKAKASAFVPTRLLDIGTDATNIVFLLDHPPKSCTYATLSHRWSASTERIKLLQRDVQSRIYSGLPISCLPEMFQDVVHVLRRLGIRYVWIDCLCIIQDADNGDDWRHEAAQMGAVYQNSLVTIVAAWCKDSRRSLFSEQRQSRQVHTAKGQAPIRIRRRIPHFSQDRLPEPNYDRFLDVNWPLFTRGWVFQERALSTRLLHFTRDEILWECMSTTTCQCTPREGMDFVTTRMSKTCADRNLTPKPAVDVSTLADRSRAFFRDGRGQSWARIVTEFSGLDFTYEKDRLPALASVARSYGDSKGWRYLCGLWAEQFETTFDWATYGFPRRRGPHAKGSWPSWSWVSVRNKVKFRHRPGETKVAASIKDIDISYIGDKYLGEVCKARIVVSGQVFNAQLVHGSDWDDCPMRKAPTTSASCVGATCLTGLIMETKAAGFIPDFKLWRNDDDFIASQSQVICLVFRTIDYGRMESADCLVLFRDALSYPYYRRIGLCASMPTSYFENLSSHAEVTLI